MIFMWHTHCIKRKKQIGGMDLNVRRACREDECVMGNTTGWLVLGLFFYYRYPIFKQTWMAIDCWIQYGFLKKKGTV